MCSTPPNNPGARDHPTRKAERSRESILASAFDVVREGGILALTLDAVAMRSGMSKGGLLYHFGSKDDLVTAMIEARHEQMLQKIERSLAADPHREHPGAFHRALVRVMFEILPEIEGLGGPVLAAMLAGPRHMEQNRCHEALIAEKAASDGLSPLLSQLVMSCIDGVFLSMVMGLPRAENFDRQRLRDHLVDLCSFSLTEAMEPS